jgi:hypothetical protein
MKTTKLFLFTIILIIFSLQLYALPRFALRLNNRCIDCHVNPTGGELRNESGFFFGKNVISMISPRDKDFPLSPKISNNVTLGFDYRTQYLYSQEKNRTDFQDMTGSIYLSAAISQKIDIYSRYDFMNALWEGYGIARILPNDSYIKVGSFSPNFGIRLDDHTAYTRGGDFGLLFSTGTRQGLIYNPYYLENGIEIGANISDITLLTASVGRNKANGILSTDPNFTARLELTPSIGKLGLLFGGSYLSTKTKFSDPVSGSLSNLPTQLYGGFAGLGYGRFTLMGEYDIADTYTADNTKSSALMIEAAYQLMIGLEAVVRYDRFDPNLDAVNDEHSHVIVGFEFFPYSFVELRPQYRFNIENPDVKNDAFVLQFHFWY